MSLRGATDGVVTIYDWYVQTFAAYGLRFGLRVNDAVTMDAVCADVPLGWQIAPPGAVDVLYSICVAQTSQDQPNEHMLSCGADVVARAPNLDALLTVFTKHAELLTAELARDVLFVHAGVVGWQGKAIVIPGRSFSGKTTLVKALVEVRATYYSDEFAILDRQELVHPYALPLSLRDRTGKPAGSLAVDSETLRVLSQ